MPSISNRLAVWRGKMPSYLDRILPLSALIMLMTAQGLIAATVENDPSKIDLAKLIECTSYDVPSYNGFAMWLTGPESAEAMKQTGVTELPSDNFMLREFLCSFASGVATTVLPANNGWSCMV
jgi:hypothetical protein